MSIYLRLLRPADWIKNLFVFAALAFGDGIRDAHKDLLALLAFAAFCLTSSAGYILNDFLDRERDRQHPRKKDRPIASGAITPQTAAVIFVVLLLAAAAISFYLSWNLPEGAPSFTTQGLYLQFEKGDMKIDTRDRGMTELSGAGYRTVNPMYTRRTDRGYAGYAHESIGDALIEFLELKQNGRRPYDDLEKADPSGMGGFYSTLMAQMTHESLARGRSLSGGQVALGGAMDVNEYIKEKLGPDADDYLVQYPS